MDLGSAVVADEQSLVLVEPGEGALHDPAVTADPGAVLGLAARDLGLDLALPEQPPVLVVVVAAVGGHAVGSPAGTADRAAHRRYAVDERDQLGDVVTVAAGDRPRERCSVAVDKEVVLRPGAAAVDRARARRGAPFFACT